MNSLLALLAELSCSVMMSICEPVSCDAETHVLTTAADRE